LPIFQRQGTGGIGRGRRLARDCPGSALSGRAEPGQPL